jgi:hypothetical protein
MLAPLKSETYQFLPYILVAGCHWAHHSTEFSTRLKTRSPNSFGQAIQSFSMTILHSSAEPSHGNLPATRLTVLTQNLIQGGRQRQQQPVLLLLKIRRPSSVGVFQGAGSKPVQYFSVD